MRCLLEQVLKQNSSQSLVPVALRDVGVADQRHVFDRLDTHDADQDAIDLNAGEPDPMGDFVLQLFHRHVWVFPAVGGNDAAVRLRSVVDDLKHPFQVVGSAGADNSHRAAQRYWFTKCTRRPSLSKSIAGGVNSQTVQLPTAYELFLFRSWSEWHRSAAMNRFCCFLLCLSLWPGSVHSAESESRAVAFYYPWYGNPTGCD